MSSRWLVLYDISDPSRLRKIAKLMEGQGIRVQKSLFECNWNTAHAKMVFDQMHDIVNSEEDYVLFFPRCVEDTYKTLKIGKGSNIDSNEPLFRVL